MTALETESLLLPGLETQLADLFERLILPADWLGQVLRAARKFANPETQQDVKNESAKLQAALQRAMQLYLWGDLDEIEYRREKVKLELALKQLGSQTLEPAMLVPRLESGVEVMKSARTLWEAPGVTQETKGQLVRELFEEVKVGLEGIVSVRPRPEYVPLFACAEYVNGRGERSPVDSTHLEIVGVEDMIEFWDKQARSA